ncbi:glycosyltransferase family 2 protein [Dyella sp. BiH032]|uniref:glycosyltransferase family 2 protein n=1 Tax=Dyella sp. BiH032 TaxID=3075430 RepID=UPI002892FEE7|nr:glycosyltransferase family 2 protein [Dyella sp. BiH032]WNL45284.1 glycosyltransferase family 2 protein [Dyella sp. BiH032]
MSERIGSAGGTLAVVVAYHPDAESLRRLLGALVEQVHAVVVVDNTPAGSLIAAEEVRRCEGVPVRLIQWGENRGIAEALNEGIRLAQSESFEFVLLSDQDSLPPANMVRGLYEVFENASATGLNVACVSPQYFDRTTNQAFPFQVQKPDRLFYSNAGTEAADPWLEAFTTITSGSLIPVRVLKDVGGMRAEYFIDNVDIEWCLRARHMGYVILGTSKVRLHHQLGQNPFRVWVLRWRLYGTYSPVRFYYKYRNFLLMWRLSYVPLRWKLRACWYWIGQFYAYVFFSPDRWKNLSMIAKGIRDGMLGRTGPIDRLRK